MVLPAPGLPTSNAELEESRLKTTRREQSSRSSSAAIKPAECASGLLYWAVTLHGPCLGIRAGWLAVSLPTPSGYSSARRTGHSPAWKPPEPHSSARGAGHSPAWISPKPHSSAKRPGQSPARQHPKPQRLPVYGLPLCASGCCGPVKGLTFEAVMVGFGDKISCGRLGRGDEVVPLHPTPSVAV